MNSTLAPIEEILRMPSPCPAPIGLACDGPNLWVGSLETARLYGLNAQQWTVFEEAVAPGRPFGMCVIGDELRVIVGDENDDRSIRRYIVGKRFKNKARACPNDTGSFLAYDGDSLFLSQRFDKQIVELDDDCKAVRTIPFPLEITGMTIVGGLFYCLTTDGIEGSTDYRLLRMDARRERPEIVELAAVPFAGRSLAFDGTRFWSNCRAENTIVAFVKPD